MRVARVCRALKRTVGGVLQNGSLEKAVRRAETMGVKFGGAWRGSASSDVVVVCEVSMAAANVARMVDSELNMLVAEHAAVC
jgi:hypothetical protein